VIRVLDARFVGTAVSAEGYPPTKTEEIAFVGRSNVGKSSMINALAERKKLVRVSNTPGRTRTLNFFDVDLDANGERKTLRLVDLPGYGFAKASKSERRDWGRMISAYLERREALKAVVCIIDAEVGPTRDDEETLTYLSETAPRILVVATKIDRLPKAKRKPRALALAQKVGLDPAAVVPFSASEKIGVQEVWECLLESLHSSTA
jgi:GTP-binding protein